MKKRVFKIKAEGYPTLTATSFVDAVDIAEASAGMFTSEAGLTFPDVKDMPYNIIEAYDFKSGQSLGTYIFKPINQRTGYWRYKA